MADIFLQSDVKSLLKNKFVLLIGDSNTRALYKDLVWLICCDTLIDNTALRRRMELSFLGDKLVKRSDLHRGRDYKEVRRFVKDEIEIQFNFITRCYNEDIVELLESFRWQRKPPDVIFFNSFLWDISRWGPDGVPKYKENMIKLMKLIESCIPKTTLVVWGTTLPISSDVRGGFMIKQIEFLKHTLRFEVMEGNYFARQLVVSCGYDILDLHYHIRMQVHRRCKDGIHYMNIAVRQMINLLLTHIALAWDHKLPGNFTGQLLDKITNLDVSAMDDSQFKGNALAEIENIARKLGKAKRRLPIPQPSK